MGWEYKEIERYLVVILSKTKSKSLSTDGGGTTTTTSKSSSSNSNTNDVTTIYLKQCATVDELMDQVTVD